MKPLKSSLLFSLHRIMRWSLGLVFFLNFINQTAEGMLAGGRPNSISGGNNAFAGVVNPANAVWIKDRFDIGLFLVHQKISLNNLNNNPLFPPGHINQSYRSESIITVDGALHKRLKIKNHDYSISLATYSTPGYLKLRTKKPFPIAGDTPIHLEDKTQVVSAVFSLKLNEQHSIGFSLDYFYLSHLREGYQKSDNPQRSVSPGHVTNNGFDHSNGLGLSLGWRWNLTRSLTFGLAFVKRSAVGQFKKYRGFEPQHAKNFIPETVGTGFTYRFNKKLAGRIEALWTHSGNLPNSNNAILPNGKLNTAKRGSKRCSGSGLQDATFINLGLGYKFNPLLSIGVGFSHRIKLPRKSPYIISHSYINLTTFNQVTFGANFDYHRHNIYFTLSHGFENRQSGYLPKELKGGKFISKKCYDSFLLAWGYLY